MTIDERYLRQMALPQIGERGQARLAVSRVLIIGVGGLGTASSIYLAAAGVGHLGLVDFDVVSRSNLQRQVLYDECMVGKPKVICAKERLSRLNGDIDIKAINEPVTEDNAMSIISDYDIVVDGCDNMATRLLTSDICHSIGKPYVYGAISEFGGQVAVLCTKGGKTLRDIFGWSSTDAVNASNAVIGITPGIVGTVQANQTLQLLCGFGEPLIDRLWVADFLTMQTSVFDIA